MEKKIILGTLGGALTGMIVAGIIFYGLLGNMAEQWMQDNAACLKEMNIAWGIAGSIVLSLLITILLHKLGINTFKGGAVTGAWITFFIVLWYGLWNVSTYQAYTLSWLPIDVIGNTVTGALAAGVSGWILGKVR